jgi:isopenicillin-N epimerase
MCRVSSHDIQHILANWKRPVASSSGFTAPEASLKRRNFLVRASLGVAAGALGVYTPDGANLNALDRRTQRFDDWSRVRDQFALTRDFIHLGGLLLASHPAPVAAAIEDHRRGLDVNPVHYLQEQGPRLESAVRRAAADYLGTSPAELALTDSTTMGLGLLYNGLDLRSGQDILTTTHDFFATHQSLRAKAATSGASLRMIPLYDRSETAAADDIVRRIAVALRPETRLVALTWVHSSTGVKLPIRRIADVLAETNAGRPPTERVLLSVDGVHGLGVEDAGPMDLGCDFFIAGCHKWLFGPRGTGILWGRSDAWSATRPIIPSFTDDGTPGGRMTPGGFHSFEHRWALTEAFEFHRRIGRARVAERIRELNRQFKEGLATMGHARLYTPRGDDLSSGLVCFDLDGLAPRAVVQRLRERGIIATVTPYSPSYARVAPGLLNSPEEIDATLAAIRALA